MTIDSITQVVVNIQSIHSIVLGLAIAEAFKQAVRELRPLDEHHTVTVRDWFECVYPGRLVSLLVFLLLAVPMFLGNQKYLYTEYVAPLRGLHPPERVSAFWLNLDELTFLIEAGLLFVMSRSLSARRWQQFYATVVILLSFDVLWVWTTRWRGADAPKEWITFDVIAIVICSVVIAVDRFFVRYERGKELNIYCFTTISLIAIFGQIYSYLYQVDYLVGH